jgi:hypothetical protein
MHPVLSQETIARIAREEQHFARAPEAFFQAWKRGVTLAGPEWFGDGTDEGLRRATCKVELRPNLPRMINALSVLSHGEGLFLSAMVSFYNAAEGTALLRRCAYEGLSDLNELDLTQRQVIADLLLNHQGW